MIRFRRPAPAVVFAAALLLGPALAHAAGDGRFSLSGDRVHVYNLAGAVKVTAGAGTSVTVVSRMQGKDAAQISVQTFPGNEPALVFQYPGKTILYRPESAGSRNTFRSNLDVGADGRFGDGWGKNGLGLGRRKVEIKSSGSGTEAWTDLDIAIPRGQRVAIHLGVGAVTVANVDGELLVDCAAASVEAQGTRGTLKIDTGSGAVSARDVGGLVLIDTGSGGVAVNDFTGSELLIDTGSGDVRLAAITADERVSVDSGSGRVEIVEVRSPRVAVDTGSGSVFMRLAGTPRDVSVDTGSGAVTIEAPATLDAMVEMETGSGALEVDFPMKSVTRDDDHVTGTIGKGTGRVVLETGSGRIRLVRV